MKIVLPFHLGVVLDAATFATVKGQLESAGHTVLTAAENEGETILNDMWAKAQTEFPASIDAIHKGITDLKDASLSGAEKAVKVAEDVLPSFPAIWQELSGFKDFLVSGVTKEFAKVETDFVNGVKAVAAKL